MSSPYEPIGFSRERAEAAKREAKAVRRNETAQLRAALAAKEAELAEAKRAYAICPDHQPDRWEGDGTCVLCEGQRLHGQLAAQQETIRRRAELMKTCCVYLGTVERGWKVMLNTPWMASLIRLRAQLWAEATLKEQGQ